MTEDWTVAAERRLRALEEKVGINPPPDPLDAEVRKILGGDIRLWGDVSLDRLRKALERGIEIGRTTPDRSDG